jgi:alpha-D-xyloside xylohydrolase
MLCVSRYIVLFILGTSYAAAQEHFFEGTNIKVYVSDSPFSFRIESHKGTVLVKKLATDFRFNRVVAQPHLREVMVLADGIKAAIHLQDGKQFGRLSMQIKGECLCINLRLNSIIEIEEKFHSEDEQYFGIWEHGYHTSSRELMPTIDSRPANNYPLSISGIKKKYYETNIGGDCAFANARAPFFFNNNGWGIYVESDSVDEFRLGVGGKTSFSVKEDNLRYNILLGKSALDILENFNNATNRISLPALWAYGPFFWRDDAHQGDDNHKNAQDRILGDAKSLSSLNIPCTGIWIDRPYGTGARGWGNMDFDNSFPNPRKLISALSEDGYRTILWISNRCSDRLYREGSPMGFLMGGPGSGVDLRNDKAKLWMQSNLEELVDYGISGFKIDRGEEGEVPDHLQNEFSIKFAEIALSALQKKRRTDDLFLISRNMHDRGRTMSAVFNGDPDCSFSGLKQSLINGLNSNLILFPMWGSDSGGYGPGVPSKELFARWLAFSAFCPVMEVLIGPRRTIWANYDQEMIDICRRFCIEHQRLVPYIHAAMQQCIDSGKPVMRPLFLDFPNSKKLNDTWDQYMFGEALLVAPVITDENRRIIKLPPGMWVDYWSRTSTYQGDSEITLDVPLNRIPVFIKAGEILSEGNIVRNNLIKDPKSEPVFVHWFPSTDVAQSSTRIPLSGGDVVVTAGIDTNGDCEVNVKPGNQKVILVVHTKHANRVRVDGNVDGMRVVDHEVHLPVTTPAILKFKDVLTLFQVD